MKKITSNISNRYIPISEKTKEKDIKPQKNKSWFTSS